MIGPHLEAALGTRWVRSADGPYAVFRRDGVVLRALGGEAVADRGWSVTNRSSAPLGVPRVESSAEYSGLGWASALAEDAAEAAEAMRQRVLAESPDY